MAIYEVEGWRSNGSESLSLERFYDAVDAVDAVTNIIAYYSNSTDKGTVWITKLGVWGTRVGTPEYDPNTLCDCHSSPLWRCYNVVPSNVVIMSDKIGFTVGGLK